uniref:MYND-type domain-containing protein n=1 Tax=Panagrolaimus superbus TaxID=310955 RepID=A0A914XUZ7_9BILA
MLLKNRELFLQLAARPNDKYNTVPKPASFPKPPRLASLKAITLKDINPTIDKVYDGYVLEVKIIDFSYLMVAINTVIEDENGDIQRLAVYNWPLKGDRKAEIAEAIKTFRPNVMVSIINPYMRLSSDMKNIIRVENPVYIRLDNTSADQKCTFCGKEAKVLPCSKCMMVRYCSKECQRIDWIEFKHKEMCEHLKNYLS